MTEQTNTLFEELQKTERLLQEQRKRINEMTEECARLAEKAAALRKELQEVCK